MSKPTEFERFPPELASQAPFGPYRAVVKRIIDGDTIYAFLDLGLNKYAYEPIRLLEVLAPEINRGTPEERQRGQEARQHLLSLIPEGAPVVIITVRDTASFGRYIGDVWSQDGSVNEAMREYLERNP